MKLKSILLTAVANLAMTAATIAQVPNYVPTNGLVGYWPFNGNANDESGNGYNGTVNGATLISDRFGNGNSAYRFNGTTNSITSSLNTIAGNSYTISAWFNNYIAQSMEIGLVVSRTTWNVSTGLYLFNNTEYLQSTSTCNSFHYNSFSVNNLNDSIWHLYTASFDGNTFNIYVDGSLASSITSNIQMCINAPFIFGNDNLVPNRFFNGLMDDIGIWNRALTQQEVNDLYNAQTCTATINASGSTIFCQGGSVVLNANTGAGLTYQWRNNGNNISGATAASYTANAFGSYSVVVTDGNGCSAISTAIAVTVNPSPTATITAGGATTFCQGGSVVLNANSGAGLTYQWRNNSNNISGATNSSYTTNAAGSYTVVVTNSNGCSATSASTAVTVNPSPTATITAGGATTFCQGGSVVLNANNGAGLTYQWRNNGNNISGATNASYTANASGSYTVVVTNSNGCSATSSSTAVTVNPPPTVSISGLSNFTNYNANPVSVNGNPSGGSFTGPGISGTSFNPQAAGLGSSTITYSYINGNGCSNIATQNTVVYDTLGVVCTSYDTITTNVFDTTFVAQTVYDTIQVTVYDTLLTTVTDTLIINSVLTGINPPNNLNKLKVFPNPANTHITINYGNFSSMSGYTLTIVNSIGQTVFTTPINQQSSYIDLSTWSGNGIYFVQLIDPQNNTIENRKIVIQ